MKPRHQVSKQAIELIKRFEGYRRTAAALPDGRWTIGYGHIKTARPGAEVSDKDAEALLIYDLLEVTKAVNDWTFTPLTQNQFDALVCFAFNVGLENFRRSSVLRRVNEGAMLQAACAFEMWRKADFEGERIVIDALVRRRAAEKSLFLTPTHGWVPAPSPVVRPRVDYDASSAQPKQRPMTLIVPMDGPNAQAHEEIQLQPQADEAEPASPATLAADAVSARLQALVPEPAPEQQPAEADAGLDLPSPPPPAVEPEEPMAPPPVSPSTMADPFDFALTPPADTQEEELAPIEVAATLVDPASQPLPFDAEPEPAQPVVAAEAEPAPRIIQTDFDMSGDRGALRTSPDFGLEDAEPMKFDLWPLVALGVVGLVSFGFAIVWGLFAAPSSGGVLGPWVVSWAAGIFGIGCVVVAVYLLLEKLGGSEE